jgi:hypothetical protein
MKKTSLDHRQDFSLKTIKDVYMTTVNNNTSTVKTIKPTLVLEEPKTTRNFLNPFTLTTNIIPKAPKTISTIQRSSLVKYTLPRTPSNNTIIKYPNTSVIKASHTIHNINNLSYMNNTNNIINTRNIINSNGNIINSNMRMISPSAEIDDIVLYPQETIISDIKPITINPIGLPNSIPTTERKVLPTPMTIPKVKPKLVLVDAYNRLIKDPLLDLVLIFDRDVSTYTTNLINSVKRSCSNIEWMNLLPYSGIVTNKMFYKALDIYENNQDYLRSLMNNNNNDIIIKEINNLEFWFMCIIEPLTEEDWVFHEKHKIINGYSFYCSYDLRKYIQQMPNNIKEYILFQHHLIKI